MAPALLRILTTNLFNGRADPVELGRLLDDFEPDVVAAQEMAPSAATAIARRLPHGLLLPARNHTGIGLASIQPIEVTPVALPHRDALLGRLSNEVTVMSVHLANPIDLPASWRLRRAQVAALERFVGSIDAPRLVLVGDLNATPAWPAYRRLRRQLCDGVADWAAREGRRPSRTWGYAPGSRPLLRIDHALTRGVELTDARTVRIPGSDHLGLVVDVG